MKRTEEMRRIEKTWESMRRVNGPVGKSGELKTSSSEQSCKPRLRQEVVPVLSTIPMAYSMVGKVLSLCSTKEACDYFLNLCTFVLAARKTTPSEHNRLCKCIALHEPELELMIRTSDSVRYTTWKVKKLLQAAYLSFGKPWLYTRMTYSQECFLDVRKKYEMKSRHPSSIDLNQLNCGQMPLKKQSFNDL